MKKVLLLLAVLMGSLTTLMSQDKVYLTYFEVINMDQKNEYSVTKLYKVYLEGTSRYSITLPTYEEGAKIDFEAVRNKAKVANANYFILGELNKSAESIVVSVSMYDTENGNKVWSDYIKANGPEFLDAAIEALAHVTGTKQKASVQQAYNATEYDYFGNSTSDVKKYYGLTVGGAASFISSEVNEPTLGGFGALFVFDIDNLIFDIKGETYYGENSNLFFLELDVNRPLKTTPITPYIMGGLGYGSVRIRSEAFTNGIIGITPQFDNSERENSGLMAFVGGGYIFNRNRSIRLRASAKGYVGAYELLDNKYPFGVIFGLTLLIKQ